MPQEGGMDGWRKSEGIKVKEADKEYLTPGSKLERQKNTQQNTD